MSKCPECLDPLPEDHTDDLCVECQVLCELTAKANARQRLLYTLLPYELWCSKLYKTCDDFQEAVRRLNAEKNELRRAQMSKAKSVNRGAARAAGNVNHKRKLALSAKTRARHVGATHSVQEEISLLESIKNQLGGDITHLLEEYPKYTTRRFGGPIYAGECLHALGKLADKEVDPAANKHILGDV